MKRQWVWAVLIIIGILIFRLRSSGQLPVPTDYQNTSDGIRISAAMTGIPGNSNGEIWNLTSNGKGTYYINVYLNGRQQKQFATKQVISKKAGGTTYQTTGTIQLGQQKYHATDIFIDVNGNSGYIDFTK